MDNKLQSIPNEVRKFYELIEQIAWRSGKPTRIQLEARKISERRLRAIRKEVNK